MNMNTRSQNTVTVNLDSTTQQVVLSNPTMGIHVLDILDGLKISYWDTVKEIENVEGSTKGWEYERVAQLKNLRERKARLQSDFAFWSECVKNWVSQFTKEDSKYGEIIIEYYCNIVNYSVGQKEPPDGALKLQDILDEELSGEKDRNKKSNNFRAKIRQITLNLIKSQK